MPLASKHHLVPPQASTRHASTYSSRYFSEEIPQYELPEQGVPADAAYQLVHDALNMDGNPALNLASFVTTWMKPEAVKLMHENLYKNFIDHDEYPQTAVMHHRCVNMLARLFNAPQACTSMGTATMGSSEAIMLGLLAYQWTWKNSRKQAQAQPHLWGNVYVCWESVSQSK